MLQKLLFLCRFYANAEGRETEVLAAHFLPTTDTSPPVSAEKRAGSKGGEVFGSSSARDGDVHRA